MAEPVLDQPRVVASIGHGPPARRGAACERGRQMTAWRARNCFHEAINGVSRKSTPRSVSKTKAPVGIALQLAQHAQFIAAGSGWTAGLPLFARRTCSAGLRPHSTCDHSRSAISTAQAVPETNQDQRSVPVAVAPQAWRRRSASRPRPGSGRGTHLGVRFSHRCFSDECLFGSTSRRFGTISIFPHPDSNLPDNATSSESRTGCKCRVSRRREQIINRGYGPNGDGPWRRAADDQAKRRSADLKNTNPHLPTRCRAPGGAVSPAALSRIWISIGALLSVSLTTRNHRGQRTRESCRFRRSRSLLIERATLKNPQKSVMITRSLTTSRQR